MKDRAVNFLTEISFVIYFRKIAVSLPSGSVRDITSKNHSQPPQRGVVQTYLSKKTKSIFPARKLFLALDFVPFYFVKSPCPLGLRDIFYERRPWAFRILTKKRWHSKLLLLTKRFFLLKLLHYKIMKKFSVLRRIGKNRFIWIALPFVHNPAKEVLSRKGGE